MFISAKEVMQLLDISQSHAYRIIQTLNQELSELGYYTIRGKTSKIYFLEKFDYQNKEDPYVHHQR